MSYYSGDEELTSLDERDELEDILWDELRERWIDEDK